MPGFGPPNRPCHIAHDVAWLNKYYNCKDDTIIFTLEASPFFGLLIHLEFGFLVDHTEISFFLVRIDNVHGSEL